MENTIVPKWPKRLVIVRHGQSKHNVALDLLQEGLEELLHTFKGIRDADIELSPFGEWQADKTGLYLATTPEFDICFTSPYERTFATARHIVAQLPYNVRIFPDDRLREKEFGRLHALSKAEIKTQYPEEFEDRRREGKYWYRLPRGENYPDVGMRTHQFAGKLERDWGGKQVLVVTHQVPYKMFRAMFEHLHEKEVLALENSPNCGMQVFTLDTSKYPEGRMKLEEYNRVAYDPTEYKKAS